MNRKLSVDLVRVISIFAIIIIHTHPFKESGIPIGNTLDLATILNQIARIAVPCFFVLSGFFWAAKLGETNFIIDITMRTARRIAIIFCVWSAIYVFPYNIFGAFTRGPLGPIKSIYWQLENVVTHPLRTLLEGTEVHLWYLPALLCCLAISAAFLVKNKVRSLIALSLSLYAIGLLGNAYSGTPYGFHVEFNFRDGPFFGLIFFVTGYVLHRKGPKESWLFWGLTLLGAGLCLHFIELQILHRLWDISMRQDYVIGTYFAGVGWALIALSDSKSLSFPKLPNIGPLVLGIYAVHLVFVELLKPLDQFFTGSISWAAGYPSAVFLMSTATAYAMSKITITKSIVI